MNTVNNLPTIDGYNFYVKGSYLFNNEESNVLIPCTPITVKTLRGHAPIFEVYLHGEYSCLYDKVPVHALVFESDKAGIANLSQSQLQYWDCSSHYSTVVVKSMLAGCRVCINIKPIKEGESIKMFGHYLYTIDFAAPDPNLLNVDYSEHAGEHKSMNVIALDNGQIAIYPNNRIIFLIPSLGASLEKVMAFDGRSQIKTAEFFPSSETEYLGEDLSASDNFFIATDPIFGYMEQGSKSSVTVFKKTDDAIELIKEDSSDKDKIINSALNIRYRGAKVAGWVLGDQLPDMFPTQFDFRAKHIIGTIENIRISNSEKTIATSNGAIPYNIYVSFIEYDGEYTVHGFNILELYKETHPGYNADDDPLNDVDVETMIAGDRGESLAVTMAKDTIKELESLKTKILMEWSDVASFPAEVFNQFNQDQIHVSNMFKEKIKEIKLKYKIDE